MCLHILGFNAAHLEIYESIYRNVCLYVFRVHHVQMNVQCMPFSFFSYMYLCCIQPKYFREICSPIFISVCCSICAATVPNLCKVSDQFARNILKSIPTNRTASIVQILSNAVGATINWHKGEKKAKKNTNKMMVRTRHEEMQQSSRSADTCVQFYV